MTKQVRNSYRHHRKATWGLATVLVVAIAAVVIPIASGAADKTYTLLFPSTGAVTPTPLTTGNSQTAQRLCADSSYASVRLQITNTAKSVTLGSANVTLPTNVTLSGTPAFVSGAPGAATISRSGNVVSIRELSLAKSAVVAFSVPLATTANGALGAKAVQAVVKQSNNFNDSGGDANRFSDPTFPTIDVVGCTAPISGKTYLDRDGSGSFATVPGSSTSDQPKPGWAVKVFKQTGQLVGTDTTNLSGDYTIAAPIGGSFKVCVTASVDDGGGVWALREPLATADPTNLVCAKVSPTSDDPSAGRLIANLGAGGASGQNFGVVPVTDLFGARDNATTPGGDYSVTAATVTTKPEARYVQETWTDGGKVFFTFYPVTPCTTGCDQIYLLEVLKGQVDQSALNGRQARLLYDDTAPYTDFTTEMPYCKNDPRPDGWQDNGEGSTDIITTNILPSGGAKSCIVVGSQEVIGGATPKVDLYYLVFTSFDGGRGMG